MCVCVIIMEARLVQKRGQPVTLAQGKKKQEAPLEEIDEMR